MPVSTASHPHHFPVSAIRRRIVVHPEAASDARVLFLCFQRGNMTDSALNSAPPRVVPSLYRPGWPDVNPHQPTGTTHLPNVAKLGPDTLVASERYMKPPGANCC